jgi:hypothetical protein
MSRHPVPSSTSTYLTKFRENAKGMLGAWIASKALKVLPKPSPTIHRDAVVVGNRVEGTAAQDELEF